MNYFKRVASPWVSFSILAGGLLSAVILFFLAKIERDVANLSTSAYINEGQVIESLE